MEYIPFVGGLALAAWGVYLVYKIEIKALECGINGRVMATTVAVMLAIVLAVLGVKIQDVLLK